jgi:hypothetical protein
MIDDIVGTVGVAGSYRWPKHSTARQRTGKCERCNPELRYAPLYYCSWGNSYSSFCVVVLLADCSIVKRFYLGAACFSPHTSCSFRARPLRTIGLLPSVTTHLAGIQSASPAGRLAFAFAKMMVGGENSRAFAEPLPRRLRSYSLHIESFLRCNGAQEVAGRAT